MGGPKLAPHLFGLLALLVGEHAGGGLKLPSGFEPQFDGLVVHLDEGGSEGDFFDPKSDAAEGQLTG